MQKDGHKNKLGKHDVTITVEYIYKLPAKF